MVNNIDIAACCGNCKYWGNIYPKDKEYKSCELAKDMCCDKIGIFGCIGGGEFASKKDFLCKFWKSK